jgi:hypothetical protein
MTFCTLSQYDTTSESCAIAMYLWRVYCGVVGSLRDYSCFVVAPTGSFFPLSSNVLNMFSADAFFHLVHLGIMKVVRFPRNSSLRRNEIIAV